MTVLGLGSKKTEANGTRVERNRTTCSQNQNGTSEEAKKLAAVALAAAKDAAAASAALARGKIEVTINRIYFCPLQFNYCIISFVLTQKIINNKFHFWVSPYLPWGSLI